MKALKTERLETKRIEEKLKTLISKSNRPPADSGYP